MTPALREGLKNAALIALIVGAYALVGTLDYQDQLVIEKVAEARTKAGRM